MKLTWLFGGLLAATVAGTAQAGAPSSMLTFDGSICSGGPCSSGSRIDVSYGDITGVLDVQYNREITLSQTDARLSWWDWSYSDLYGVAWGSSGDATGTAEIFLKPADGYQVTLHSFELGSWPRTTRDTQVTLLSGAGATLMSSTPLTISGATHTDVLAGITSADGIRIQWGPSAYNVGIDNIAFDVTPIPEPETYALMAMGLGMIGWSVARRRKG